MWTILFESPSPKIWENDIYGVIFIQIFGQKKSNTLTLMLKTNNQTNKHYTMAKILRDARIARRFPFVEGDLIAFYPDFEGQETWLLSVEDDSHQRWCEGILALHSADNGTTWNVIAVSPLSWSATSLSPIQVGEVQTIRPSMAYGLGRKLAALTNTEGYNTLVGEGVVARIEGIHPIECAKKGGSFRWNALGFEEASGVELPKWEDYKASFEAEQQAFVPYERK